MDYLKLFENHTEYEDYVSGDTMLRPNVSHCIEENEVHYNPIKDPRVIVTYNVTDDTEETRLYPYFVRENFEESHWKEGADNFTSAEIDGVLYDISELDAASGKIQLNVGKHIVKYTLLDETSIMKAGLSGISTITKIILPDTIQTLDNYVFCRLGGYCFDEETYNKIVSINPYALDCPELVT